jgi:putative SOS response-associated peptidase YedK
MCGRFALYSTHEQLAGLFELTSLPAGDAPRYNIAPTQPIGLVRVNPQSHRREWAFALWGLIPSWSQTPAQGARLINARAETLSEKPAFRAGFRRRRCLIPASGFYEWLKSGQGKQPYYIAPADATPMAFAGLWESWQSPQGDVVESCTIVTTAAAPAVARLHDRMPLILSPADYTAWLGSGQDATAAQLIELHALLHSPSTLPLTFYPVSTYVNSPLHEGSDCIAGISTA